MREVSLSRRIRARINIGQRGEVFVGAERNPLLLPTLSGYHHPHHYHYLLSQSRENGGDRIMLAEDEEVKRVGREARRKDAPPRSRTRRRRGRPRCAPRRKEVKQWREVRKRGFRSSNLPDLYSPFSLSLFLSTLEDLQITRR